VNGGVFEPDPTQLQRDDGQHDSEISIGHTRPPGN
jgi:hypothetical protein